MRYTDTVMVMTMNQTKTTFTAGEATARILPRINRGYLAHAVVARMLRGEHEIATDGTGSGHPREYTHNDVEAGIAYWRTRGADMWVRKMVHEWTRDNCRAGWVVVTADGHLQFHETLTAGLFRDGAQAVPVHDLCHPEGS